MAESPSVPAVPRDVLAAELAIAWETQRRLLPPTPLRCGSLRLEHRVLAAGGLSGDLVDYLVLADGSVAFIVLDVAGHGLHSALFTPLLRAAFRANAGLVANGPLEDLLGALSMALAHAGTRTHAAACVGHVSADGNLVRLAGAMHHPSPLLLVEGRCTPIAVVGKPLGLFVGEHYAEQYVELPVGGRLLVFSDGVLDGRRGDDDVRLAELCARVAAAQPQADDVLAAVGVSGAALGDDVAMLLVDRESSEQ